MVELLLAFLDEARAVLSFELTRRSTVDWILCFAPILIFLEIPRYYLPQVVLLWRHRRGRRVRPRRDAGALLRRKPLVSVIIAGRNEAPTIEAAIQSLLAQEWPALEILVVDDHSDDGMERIARRYARRGLVRFVRNDSTRGRMGKPAAVNLGLRLVNGEFVVVVDADTTYDFRLIEAILEPFGDPRVGVVAGNVHVRNIHQNLLTRLQTLEYAVSIDLHKRWTDLLGCTLQGSGAITAFRRAAVVDAQGWTSELAEDTDVSLRMVKAGWKVAFAPDAVAITEVPSSLRRLVLQRTRWDRGGLRSYFMKHHRLMRPSVSGWSFASELWSELLFGVIATLVYPLYCGWLLWQSPWLLLLVLVSMGLVNMSLSLVSLVTIARLCKRVLDPWALTGAALASPFYKGFLRWVRFRALVLELLRLRYEDPFLPSSAWVHAPRY